MSDGSKPLVSILIPAFNAQAWIADTLRSAIAQTWERKEILVIDDGSTDKTFTIVRCFESSNVRVVTQRNQGAAAARNTAFSLSKGDYIQWLDADDLLAPDKIARQMERLDGISSKRTLLSSAWGRFLYRPGRAEFVPTAMWRNLSPLDWLVTSMGQNLFMPDHSWLVSRELTEAAGPWDTRLVVDDDGEYFCRVLLLSDKVQFVPEARVYYRLSGCHSVSYIGRSDKKMEAQWLSMQLQIDYLRSLEDSQRIRTACVNYMQGLLLYFYPIRPDLVKQAEELAEELGGKLEVPHLSWKYSWIEALFGWRLARHTQLFLPSTKWWLLRFWDTTISRIGTRKITADLAD